MIAWKYRGEVSGVPATIYRTSLTKTRVPAGTQKVRLDDPKLLAAFNGNIGFDPDPITTRTPTKEQDE